MGAETLVDLLALWGRLPASGRQAQVDEWLEDATRLVMTRYALSGQIALAYYRLVRALATGTTIADPNKPEPVQVTLRTLRSEFLDLVEPLLDEDGRDWAESVSSGNGPQGGAQPPSLPDRGEDPSTDNGSMQWPTAGADDPIRVEDLGEDFERARKAAQEAAEAEARDNLQTLGPDLRDTKVEQADKDHTKRATKAERAGRPGPTLDDLDMNRVEAEAQAGYRMAAAGERIAQNGARSTTWAAQENDKRAIGYIRVSRTGTPCGWCAMLISRGPVYRSAGSAEKTMRSGDYSDGDRYHDNCHCYAVPIFSRRDYETNPLYALNREYEELWPKVTRRMNPGDRRNDDAMTKWRRFIRKRTAQAA